MSQGRSHGRHSLENPSPRRQRLTRLGLAAGTATAARGRRRSRADRRRFPQRAEHARPTSVSGAGCAVSDEPPRDTARYAAAHLSAVSRSARAHRRPESPRAKRKLWTTAALDVRVLPQENDPHASGWSRTASRSGSPASARAATPRSSTAGAARWVTAEYLSKTKIVDPADRGLSDAPCPDGSSIEGGLQPSRSRSTGLCARPSPSSARTAARTATASTSTARPSTSWCPARRSASS